jgi:hypothetical protein
MLLPVFRAEYRLHADQANTMLSMGLNPFRKQRKTTVDVAMMIVAIAAAVGVVLWAVLSN